MFDKSPVLIKESKHVRHGKHEYWAEDGLILAMELEDNKAKNLKAGDVSFLTRKDLAMKAYALNLEAKRSPWQDQRDALNARVLDLHQLWKEAKDQGDPENPEVLKQKIRERRRARILTG